MSDNKELYSVKLILSNCEKLIYIFMVMYAFEDDIKPTSRDLK